MEHNHPTHHHAGSQSVEAEVSGYSAISKEEHRRLFQRGMRWLGIGLVLMGLSFAINLCLCSSDKSFINIMYVMTSIGTVAIIKGLVDMIG